MALINKGQPFNLEFVTADRRRGTGGDFMSVKGWMKLRDDLPKEARPGHYTPKYMAKRDNQHHLNKTFQVFNPAHRHAHPITVHFRLLQSINGKRIMNG